MASEDQQQPNAKQLILDGFVDARSTICNPVFINGFAAGWFFAVPDAYRDELDICLTNRKFENGQEEVLYTQGKLYAFSRGDVFYDTPEAYQNWKDALPKIKFCVQIKAASPVTVVSSKKYQTETAVTVLEDEKPKHTVHQIFYTRTRLDYGRVKFVVLTPDLLGNRLVEDATYETDQESFVRFLQTGVLRCKDGARHDFAEFVPSSRRAVEYTQAEIAM